jgi:alpha-ketoglutarate-dependent taurine dioxygenase
MTADPESTTALAIAAVSLAGDRVSLTWSDGLRQDIHAACLRHSPGFPGGERPAGEQGRFPDGPAGLAPRRTTLDASGDLQLEWQPGGIRSTHAALWLRERFERGQLRGQQAPGLMTWDARTIRDLPQPSYNSLQRDEAARFALFEQVLNWGVTRVRDLPRQPGIVETVAGWFGQVQANPYADDRARPVICSIRVDPATPVATRQSHFLGPHTDTCWRQTLTGLLLMHCLEAHPQGGRSLLVDGFAVANRLRAESPEAFELLSTVPISFGAVVADQDDWRAQGRVISVSADGLVEGIRYNGNSIDQLDLPDELIEPMYTALQRFESILYDRDLWWRPLLAPGDLLVIDNHRVLHGREGFDAAAGERLLQCCNVERDDFHNRYRRLARLRGRRDWARRLSAGVF